MNLKWPKALHTRAAKCRSDEQDKWQQYAQIPPAIRAGQTVAVAGTQENAAAQPRWGGGDFLPRMASSARAARVVAWRLFAGKNQNRLNAWPIQANHHNESNRLRRGDGCRHGGEPFHAPDQTRFPPATSHLAVPAHARARSRAEKCKQVGARQDWGE